MDGHGHLWGVRAMKVTYKTDKKNQTGFPVYDDAWSKWL